MQLLTWMVLQLCQGMFKIWHIDITKCFVNHFLLVINYPIEDVITTFKEFSKHWLAFWLVDKVDLPTQFFLRAKPKWLKIDIVWFMTSPIGHN